MKAIAYEEYGSPDVLELKDVRKPNVEDDRVLVRVRAASANPYDWHFMRGVPYIARLMATGLRKPKHSVLGTDVAGEVEAIGNQVTRFRPGDEVFGFVGAGGFAEYVAAPEKLLALKPANLSFQQAATVPLAAVTALQGLRDVGEIRSGQKVLIVGASGGVGTFAVQIAKWYGADVTGVCSTRNLEMVRSIGANRVIDYTREDFTRTGQAYDLIFQLAGTASPSACRRALTPKGRLVLSSGDSPGRIVGPVARIIKAVLLSPFIGQTMRPLVAKPSSDDLQFLRELIEAGRVTPVIDRTYPLSAAPDAIRYLETGRARGKVVISVKDRSLA
ncbi:MAG: NAD(P)-dependent alcohol dehydrogenase [Chloroflexi bacterium]|nr:MAG: NAD(P)-dependent alcohol dehydrogenase [Chloroflexota bacterium]TME79115.1 MAG: NAD(P)-dependent alcohol dehydrogenase [Chloroflexota bacterium]